MGFLKLNKEKGQSILHTLHNREMVKMHVNLNTHHFWGIDDSCVVAKLQHAQHCSKNCIWQEERQSLQHNDI